MQLGTEEKHLSMKRLMIIFVISFTILVIILLVLHFDKIKQITTQIINPQPEVKQNETAPEQLSESEINQIKMDIVTGKREDVPVEIGKPRSLIINEYLYDCSTKLDVKDRIACYEIYYLNNDQSLKQEKQSCESLSGGEKTKCLDNFYYKMATQISRDFCAFITNQELKDECMKSVE